MICPKCKVDQEVVFEMMLDRAGSDNREHALKIIKNCEKCEKAVAKETNWLSKNIP